ncbi:hypothetical protein NX059_007472 [Plenodomus lindquistii]|nr:hypothetical protein NX059_007472 [Plenodomus lindquistii]
MSSRRKANVYDAVAGGVARDGLIENSTGSKDSKQPLRPDEVLFKQAKAPIRYEETDYYHAHATSAVQQQLPNGDLLMSIQSYVSKLYSRTARPGHDNTWKCMDETSLIACGILLEETARELLGSTGDLAFTEATNMEGDKAANVGAVSAMQGTPSDHPTDSAHSESSSSESDSRYTTDNYV